MLSDELLELTRYPQIPFIVKRTRETIEVEKQFGITGIPAQPLIFSYQLQTVVSLFEYVFRVRDSELFDTGRKNRNDCEDKVPGSPRIAMVGKVV
jgi:hypothetical protein